MNESNPVVVTDVKMPFMSMVVFMVKWALVKGISVVLVLAVSGCESLSPYETAWQTAHLVDVMQTLNGPASDACYYERDPITRSLIGGHPDRDAVIAWGIGLSVAHYFAGKWMDKSDWPNGVKTVIRSIDLGYKGITVGRNHDAGLRPFGNNSPCPIEQECLHSEFRSDTGKWVCLD